MIERRFYASSLRAEQQGSRIFLSGYAAVFDVISHDLGGWRERISPGAFDAVLERPDLDAVCNFNHSADKILGRTTSRTLTLKSDQKGLAYRAELPNTSYAADVAALLGRGDLSSSSWAFRLNPGDDEWSEVEDPDRKGIMVPLRTITNVSELHDVSVVSTPAYPQTAAELASRSIPRGLRNKLKLRAVDSEDEDPDVCDCGCEECLAGNCEGCTNPDCEDENCRCATRAGARGEDHSPSKPVGAERLYADAFLIAGDAEDPTTWALPWKFSAPGATANRLRELLGSFDDEAVDVPAGQRADAFERLRHLCIAHGIDVDEEESDRAARARRLEVAMMQ